MLGTSATRNDFLCYFIEERTNVANEVSDRRNDHAGVSLWIAGVEQRTAICRGQRLTPPWRDCGNGKTELLRPPPRFDQVVADAL